MGLYKYSMKAADEKKVARAQAYDLDCSYKDLANICSHLKGKLDEEAKEILKAAIDKTAPIPYKFHNTGMGHRSELGGLKGRYPRKECKIMLGVLENAVANATRKGLDASALVITQAAAYKQNTLPRYRRIWPGGATIGYGKQATRSDYETARVEVVVAEMPKARDAKAAREKKRAKNSAGIAAKKAAKEAKAGNKGQEVAATAS